MLSAHGQVNAPAPHHAGDVGMSTCGADGNGELKVTTSEWKLAAGDMLNPLGHAVVVHGLDMKARVGCGVITSNQ
ncbi:MAG: Copper/zinc superoxide dismutase [Pseudomonadota bacterium]